MAFTGNGGANCGCNGGTNEFNKAGGGGSKQNGDYKKEETNYCKATIDHFVKGCAGGSGGGGGSGACDGTTAGKPANKPIVINKLAIEN